MTSEPYLHKALEYRQLCLDLLPTVDTEVDDAINSCFEESASENIDPPVVHVCDTLFEFDGNENWISVSQVVPVPGSVIVVKSHDNEQHIVCRTSFNEYQSPIGTLLLQPVLWRLATKQEEIDYDNLQAAHVKGMKDITDLLA